MAYRHFGKIGDIWKHLPLCEVIQNEDITTYVETNSAYFDYKLTHTEEQNYGIGWLINKSEHFSALKKSEYYRLIKPYYEKNKYLGSCALAIHLIQNIPDKYIFFDLDEDALKSIEKSVEKLELSHKVETINMDSATGLIELIPKLNNQTFIHIDPYMVYQPNKDGYSYLDGFIKASRKGSKCFLWYGFDTLKQKKEINDKLILQINEADGLNTSCDELILKEIEENAVKINPGVLGCGILTSNLTDKSMQIIKDYASLLVQVYRDSKFKGMSGELYHEPIILRNEEQIK